MNSQLEKYQSNFEDIKERSDAEKLHYYPNLVESLLIELSKKSDYSEWKISLVKRKV